MIDIEQRITAAIERITSGNAPMRVPADETDPDLVLADCLAEIRRLRAALSARQPVVVDLPESLHDRVEALREVAARQPVESEENVAADTYWTLAEMIEPHVQREGINPDGALPASVHDSVAILLEHWLRTRQPVGEPVEHDCANCDRRHAEVICPTCAGIAWDNGRLHEFHEVRELSTSLGEGVLDHLLPDEWHEKPLLRFQGAHDEGDDSVGISPRSANVLSEDQNGTVLGDYLAARAAKEGGQ
ncbi:hypothetical protein PAERUG_E15_London_28_01_14_04149 [Pseudomonas aeruginosa]|nr:hypothetical protein PAERUG_E15_London_28_01_14_04149 [Pseudomonas aeruginosa]